MWILFASPHCQVVDLFDERVVHLLKLALEADVVLLLLLLDGAAGGSVGCRCLGRKDALPISILRVVQL